MFKAILLISTFVALDHVHAERERCSRGSYTYMYCQDGYYCCNNDTRCCKRVKLTVGAIVGIVLGSITFFAVCIAVAILVKKKLNKGVVVEPKTVAVVNAPQPYWTQGPPQPVLYNSTPILPGPAHPPPGAQGPPPPMLYNRTPILPGPAHPPPGAQGPPPPMLYNSTPILPGPAYPPPGATGWNIYQGGDNVLPEKR